MSAFETCIYKLLPYGWKVRFLRPEHVYPLTACDLGIEPIWQTLNCALAIVCVDSGLTLFRNLPQYNQFIGGYLASGKLATGRITIDHKNIPPLLLFLV